MSDWQQTYLILTYLTYLMSITFLSSVPLTYLPLLKPGFLNLTPPPYLSSPMSAFTELPHPDPVEEKDVAL